MESAVCVLKTSVTMVQRMRIRIGFYCTIKGLENQWVIVAFSNYIGNDTTIIKIGTDKTYTSKYGSNGCPDKSASGMFG